MLISPTPKTKKKENIDINWRSSRWLHHDRGILEWLYTKYKITYDWLTQHRPVIIEILIWNRPKPIWSIALSMVSSSEEKKIQTNQRLLVKLQHSSKLIWKRILMLVNCFNIFYWNKSICTLHLYIPTKITPAIGAHVGRLWLILDKVPGS